MSKVNCDVDGLSAMLLQIGDRAVRGVSNVMVSEGKKIQELAVSNAPVDEGNLEEAIKIEIDRGGINGRTRVSIFVDEDMDAGHGKTVGDYAARMHEGLAPYGSGAYNLGEKSRQKANSGHNVGGKYMERAIDEREDELMRKVYDIVRKSL